MKKLVAPTAPTATDREEHTASPAIAVDYGYLHERDDLLQEAAGAPILVSKCNRDRWIGADHCANKGCRRGVRLPEIENGEISSGLHRGSPPGRTLYVSQKQRVSRGCCEGCERCRENELGLASSDALDREFQGRHPVLPWLVKHSVADGEQVQKRSRWQDSPRAAQGAHVRESTAAFCGEDPLHDPCSHESGWRESNQDRRMGIFFCVCDRSDEL